MDYISILENWLTAFTATGATDVVIVALDQPTHQWVTERGIPSAAVPLGNEKGALWILRMKIFAALLRAGVSFVHSDADALWRTDPREGLSAQNTDLLLSQGTIWPEAALDRWGFVACAGFFAAKSTPETIALFAEILRVTKREKDDQRALNLVLLDQIASWEFEPDSTYALDFRGKVIRCSTALVRASTVTGLGIGLLPNRLFLRVPEPDTLRAFVHHPLSPKNVTRKVTVLAASGDWHLQE